MQADFETQVIGFWTEGPYDAPDSAATQVLIGVGWRRPSRAKLDDSLHALAQKENEPSRSFQTAATEAIISKINQPVRAPLRRGLLFGDLVV